MIVLLIGSLFHIKQVKNKCKMNLRAGTTLTQSLRSLMKAIVFTQYGPPDGLELKEVQKPAPKDDELLISVHASSINSWDWEFLNGIPFINRLMF